MRTRLRDVIAAAKARQLRWYEEEGAIRANHPNGDDLHCPGSAAVGDAFSSEDNLYDHLGLRDTATTLLMDAADSFHDDYHRYRVVRRALERELLGRES